MLPMPGMPRAKTQVAPQWSLFHLQSGGFQLLPLSKANGLCKRDLAPCSWLLALVACNLLRLVCSLMCVGLNRIHTWPAFAHVWTKGKPLIKANARVKRPRARVQSSSSISVTGDSHRNSGVCGFLRRHPLVGSKGNQRKPLFT